VSAVISIRIPFVSFAARSGTRPAYFTSGVWVVALVAAIGGAVWAYRMLFGLGNTTNLNDAYPWGIWIGIDVACGVALAAGGFTTAFLAHILHRERYHPLVRPALLTAMLGYTFVALGVMTDLGRFWAMWHVMLPNMWQPNSVLFEVALCVMTYVSVLYIEFLPAVCERFVGRVNLTGRASRLNKPVDQALRFAQATLGRFMTVFIIMGIMLSCMHQSSLGTLMVIAQGKLHPLWQTSLLPLHFLLSAFAVGFPMVIFESIIAHRSFRLPGETDVLSALARFVPFTLSVYLVAKIFDLYNRDVLSLVFTSGFYSRLYLLEVGVGVVLPACILSVRRLRVRKPWLFAAASMVIAGVAFNRLNVFLFAYSPLDTAATYMPAWTEIAVTAGFIALTVLIYRFIAFTVPVVEQLEHARHAKHPPADSSRPAVERGASDSSPMLVAAPEVQP
jgi:Ni/Fe-hydrogenase subunit HybB-like protein